MAEESGHCCLGELNKNQNRNMTLPSTLSGVNSQPRSVWLLSCVPFILRVASFTNTSKGHGVRWDGYRAQFCGKDPMGGSAGPLVTLMLGDLRKASPLSGPRHPCLGKGGWMWNFPAPLFHSTKAETLGHRDENIGS